MVDDVWDVERLGGNVAQQYTIWLQYYSKSVWGNEHLALPLFVQMLGIVLGKRNVRLHYQGRYNYPRIHLFFIQQSGSGKGEAMKTTRSMLRHLGARGEYIAKTTDAALLGTIKPLPGGEIEIIVGLLGSEDYLFWDEGSILLKSSPHSENLQDNLQMATDDEGIITKVLALGKLSYQSHTAICAGSYMESHINTALLEKGLFQRMLLVYRIVPEQETIDFNAQKADLIAATLADRQKLMQDFKEKIDAIDLGALRNDGGYRVVEYDLHAVRNLCKKLAAKTRDSLRNFVKTDARWQIMRTFTTRNSQIFMIAGMLAAANGKAVVGQEELDFGFGMWENHLIAVNNLLLYHNRALSAGQSAEYFRVIRDVILGCGGQVPKGKLVEALRVKGKLDMGVNNVRKLLDEFVADGKLKITEGNEDNVKLVSLAEGNG
ncbi:MAG: hypothetical protein NTX79_05465 [Candidatus Micrarchaeota archaeon]|nr:hypothetical protein [Candidatus Micrarchaeota archaeon]